MTMRKPGIKVPATSTDKIRVLATKFRGILGQLQVPAEGRLDIVNIIENKLGQLLTGYEFEVVDDFELGQDHARTYPDQCRIVVKESVYEGARSSNGRDRFTLGHEVGHLIMHRGMASYARNQQQPSRHPIYQDSEWQADTFAAELLMPFYEVQRYCSDRYDIEQRFAVSADAAAIRENTVLKKRVTMST